MSKATPWVKWYPADFLFGTADLEPNEFSVYVRVLNMIYDKQEPLLLDRELLARRCRMRPTSLDKALEVLIRAGKLILDDGYLLNERALKSIETRKEVVEKSTESAHARWKKEREKAKQIKEGGDASAMPTHRKSDAKLETRDQKPEKKATPKKAKPPAALKLDGGPDVSPARRAFDLYNEMAVRIGATVHGKMTENWAKKLAARMNGSGVVVWEEAFKMVEKSHFLCGEVPPRRGEHPFKLNIETLLRPDNFQKLMDGFYGTDRDPGEVRESADPALWTAERWRRVKAIYDHSGDWPDNAGPEPGQTGCLAPDGDSYVNQ